MNNKHIENLISDPQNISKFFVSNRNNKRFHFVEIINKKYSEKFAILDDEIDLFKEMIDKANKNRIENKKRIKEERLFRLTKKLKDLEQLEISNDFNKEIEKLDKVENTNESESPDLEIENEIDEDEENNEDENTGNDLENKPSNEDKHE